MKPRLWYLHILRIHNIHPKLLLTIQIARRLTNTGKGDGRREKETDMEK